MIGKSDCYIKKLILSLLIFVGFISTLFSQATIYGTINKYGKVTSLGTDYVIVDDAGQFGQFSAGDTVLLIQMKGARIYTLEASSYGSLENMYGQPGKHEFIIIQSVEAGTKKIIFRNNIVNAFNVDGALQIVKVPSYNTAFVDNSDLTCAPWDSTGKTGGVLAIIVGRTLSLNKNIDVSGKGFIGGAISIGTGLCVGSDQTNLDKYAFNSGFANSGFKGESPVIRGWLALNDYPPIFPGYSKGKGENLTGGGGGNGKFSGGGGGGNYGAGGKGGRELASCTPFPYDGGLGGKSIKTPPLDSGIYLGGGAGSSTYLAGSTPSPGGNGGGIIIIVCDTIKGNGKSIIANGATTTQASLNAGSGGGGGGGSVAIYLQSFSTSSVTSALTISANGGKGGNNAGTFGEGGGGGGGLVKISNISIPANVIRTVSAGGKGTRPGSPTAGDGAAGENITKFVPVLNGFLFNSIRSSVTGDQVDSICSNVIPKEIKGTLPVGGSGSYTYLWQKSYNLLGADINIPSSNSINYTPSATEADTVWFRRIVKDDVTLLTDTSKWVEIRVQTAIAGNLVGKDTTICYNQDPLSLIPLNAGPSNGNGRYTYKWIQNLTNANWDTSPNATGTVTNPGYDPPALTITTYYERVVTSGRCVDYSPAVTITVLPLITGNITTRSDSVICEGSLFNNLGASAAGGGDLTYMYHWQDSTASGMWISATGINDGPVYSADTATFSGIENRYFRRVVYSGLDSVCRNNSAPILLTRYHKIINNSILADQTICSGSTPSPLSGSSPAQGKVGDYTYVWQDSSKVSISWTTKVATDFSFSPPALTDTTWYRRIVSSGIFNSAPVCTNTSQKIRIDVHKPIVNNIASLISGPGPDTTICNGAVPDSIMGSIPTGGTDISNDYAYLWESSTTSGIAGFSAAQGVNTNKSYKPGVLTQPTWFRRKVISGKCSNESNSIRVIVLPPIQNNVISSDQTVCYGTLPAQITGTPLTGGDAGNLTWIWQESIDGLVWTAATGTGNQQNYSPPSLTIPMKYMRIIHSGLFNCCIDTSNIVSIGIHPPLPTGSITSTAAITICEGSKVPLDISLTGVSPWKVIYNENSTQVTVNNITAPVTTLLASPVTGTVLTTFNYSLFSVEDKNGCIATSLTGTRKADVYKVPAASAGPDTVVCGPTATLNATPSVGTGTWYYPAAVVASTANSPSVTVTIDSTFSGQNVAVKFIWEEINWQCRSKDSVIITFDKRVSSINAGPDTALFSFDNIFHMVADPVLVWETGLWTVVSGTGDFNDNSDNKAEVRNLSKGIIQFLWTVTNGTC